MDSDQKPDVDFLVKMTGMWVVEDTVEAAARAWHCAKMCFWDVLLKRFCQPAMPATGNDETSTLALLQRIFN